MAALSEQIAAASEEVGSRATSVGTQLWRRLGALRWWRFVVLFLAGVYFLVPLAAATRFALEKPPTVQNGHGLWFGNFTGIFSSNPTLPFSAAIIVTVQLMAVTVGIVLVLLVPTTIYIHLYTPRLRRVMDGLTALPIVIPAIVLVFGVLELAPNALKSTQYLLSIEYVVLALPYVYRSLDAALRAIDVRTLVDASRSLGGGWTTTLLRVLVPNLRTGILTGTVLAIAVVVGEFTMASLDQVVTFQVWIYNTNQDSAWVSTAASVLAFLVTFILLLGVVALDRRKGARRLRRSAPAPATNGG